MCTRLIDPIRTIVANRRKNVEFLFLPRQRDLLVENLGPPGSAGHYHRPHPQLQASLEETRHKHLLTQFDNYLCRSLADLGLKEVR